MADSRYPYPSALGCVGCFDRNPGKAHPSSVSFDAGLRGLVPDDDSLRLAGAKECSLEAGLRQKKRFLRPGGWVLRLRRTAHTFQGVGGRPCVYCLSDYFSIAGRHDHSLCDDY